PRPVTQRRLVKALPPAAPEGDDGVRRLPPYLVAGVAMRREPLAALPLVLAALTLVCPTRAAEEPSFTRTQDVIYGRKYGTALTLDVVTPKKNANGAAVVFVVSGGFFSSHDNIQPARFQVLLDRGYTIFAVVHGSQPRYQVTEIVQDLNRAVRFIRHHAQEYRIDPNRIGVV